MYKKKRKQSIASTTRCKSSNNHPNIKKKKTQRSNERFDGGTDPIGRGQKTLTKEKVKKNKKGNKNKRIKTARTKWMRLSQNQTQLPTPMRRKR